MINTEPTANFEVYVSLIRRHSIEIYQ